ncbi:MAG: hypothetical protein UE068_12905, partial [Paludibacteraceae bacterium]|nr:hypothetical protein [Paludibacteraceae bacterium]
DAECEDAHTLNRLVNTTNSVKVNNISYRHYKTKNLPEYKLENGEYKIDPRYVKVVASRDYTSDIDGTAFTVTCKSTPIFDTIKIQAKPKLEIKFYENINDVNSPDKSIANVCPGATVYMKVSTLNESQFKDECKNHVQVVSCEDLNYSVNRPTVVGVSNAEIYEVKLPTDIEGSVLNFNVSSTPYCGCSVTVPASLSVHARPVATILSDGTSGVFENNVLTLCDGTTGNLIGTGTGAGISQSWTWYDFTSNQVIGGETEYLMTVGKVSESVSRVGSYYAIVKNNETNCFSKPSNVISISTRKKPLVRLNGSSTYVCPNESAEVTVVSTSPLDRDKYILEAVIPSEENNNVTYSPMPNATIDAATNYSYALQSIPFPENGNEYIFYVRAIDKELLGACAGVGSVKFEKAAAPQLDITALKNDEDKTPYGTGRPCEGDEFYVKVVDVTGSASSDDVDMFVTLKSGDDVIELKKVDAVSYVSTNTFTADRIRKFTATAENRYSDGTICSSPEATMSLGFNKRPTFNLTATTACEKLIRTYKEGSDIGGNYKTENGQTKFSVTNLVLDKSNRSD